MQITQDKRLIYGDGTDTAKVGLYGTAFALVTYSINGIEYEGTLEDIGDSVGYLLVPIVCETPNLTIIVECEGERVIIYSVGAP